MTTSKMNPEIKEKWINALISGEYKQATGILCIWTVSNWN